MMPGGAAEVQGSGSSRRASALAGGDLVAGPRRGCESRGRQLCVIRSLPPREEAGLNRGARKETTTNGEWRAAASSRGRGGRPVGGEKKNNKKRE